MMTLNTDVSLVYYIGAGASAHSLPLVSNTPASMRKLADELGTDDCRQRVASCQTGTLEQLAERLECLAEHADSCPSIDVLARLHYLRGEYKDLRRLKTTLSAFYMVEEGRQFADPRYGHFFAYMADRDRSGAVTMPTNLRVISWNYDHQFERSFAEFTPEPDYDGRRDTGKRLQVVPPFPDKYDSGAFSILKLNGSAGARVPPSGNSQPDITLTCIRNLRISIVHSSSPCASARTSHQKSWSPTSSSLGRTTRAAPTSLSLSTASRRP